MHLLRHAGLDAGPPLPKTLTGIADRKYVLTVPACGQCNSIINDKGTASITVRRQIAHDGIRRIHARQLRTQDWSSRQLHEFGPLMRIHVERAMAKKAVILDRLSWPGDPSYDFRALEQSGIPDPYATGLLGLPDPQFGDDENVAQRLKVRRVYLPGDLLRLTAGNAAGKCIELIEMSPRGKWIARIIDHPIMPAAIGSETYVDPETLSRNWTPIDAREDVA